jgi:hypothetical protein
LLKYYFSASRNYLAALIAALLVYAIGGFLVLPWWLHKTAVEFAEQEYGAGLSFETVAVNPFVLSVRLNRPELRDPAGQALASADEIFINLQASSLFRWAWTFAEITLDAPEAFVARHASGELNIGFLAEQTAEEPGTEPSGLPRVLVFDFSINDAALSWNDRLPAEAVSTRLGPVNVKIDELNTLPQRSGQQAVVVTTPQGGTLSWTGDLQLNPLFSRGNASLEGDLFNLPSAYIRQQTGFEIREGHADIGLDYVVEVNSQGELRAAITNLGLAFMDVGVHRITEADELAGHGDRQVLRLPAFRLNGGELRWPEREVAFDELQIDDAQLAVFRAEDGQVNLVPRSGDGANGGSAASTTDEPAVKTSSGVDSWTLSLDRLAVNRMAIALEDHSVTPHAELGVKTLELELTGLSNRDGASFPLSAIMETGSGGTVSLEGTVIALPEPIMDVEVAAQSLSLALAHPYLQPLADVSLDTGTVSFTARVQSGPDEPLYFAGDLNIDDFLITETDEGTRLGSWDRVDIKSVELSLAGNSMNISEIRLKNAYGDIVIDENGGVNLGRVEKGQQFANDEGEGESSPPEPAEQAAPAADPADEMQILVGRVVFNDAGADFADLSLPLPFAARISGMEGEISTIASGSIEPSTVELEGQVDEHGFVQVSGTVTPLDPALNTDMKVAFRNVEIPKFSAYTIQFAGREIANGKLDLDLGYVVQDGSLAGENNIVLRDFELGAKVDHPDAMSLPLGLAVALLKDSTGKIDIDLPVRGDINDPAFRYGGVILKALANLIIKIVASPFALLGNLLGVEPDELSHINFIEGRADLTPPELERVDKLVEALTLRPQLVVEIAGVVDREADGAAMQAARLDTLLEERIGAADDEVEGALYPEQQLEALEKLYAESGANADPSLDALRQGFTMAPLDEDGQPGEAKFDSVAYTAELRRLLIDRQPVSDTEFAALAEQRASAVQAAITAIEPGLANRIAMQPPREIGKDKDSAIAMELVLSAGSEQETNPDRVDETAEKILQDKNP